MKPVVWSLSACRYAARRTLAGSEHGSAQDDRETDQEEHGQQQAKQRIAWITEPHENEGPVPDSPDHTHLQQLALQISPPAVLFAEGNDERQDRAKSTDCTAIERIKKAAGLGPGGAAGGDGWTGPRPKSALSTTCST